MAVVALPRGCDTVLLVQTANLPTEAARNAPLIPTCSNGNALETRMARIRAQHLSVSPAVAAPVGRSRSEPHRRSWPVHIRSGGSGREHRGMHSGVPIARILLTAKQADGAHLKAVMRSACGRLFVSLVLRPPSRRQDDPDRSASNHPTGIPLHGHRFPVDPTGTIPFRLNQRARPI